LTYRLLGSLIHLDEPSQLEMQSISIIVEAAAGDEL
jgi:hypothetical protein